MKIPKERRQLCSEVTNHHEAEERIRRAKDVERQLDTIFGYVLLIPMGIALVVAIIDVWRGL